MSNLTPLQIARAEAKRIVKDYEIDPAYVLVLGERVGGPLDGSRNDMTLGSHGWYSSKGAQIVAEDADYEWTYGAAARLNERFCAEYLVEHGKPGQEFLAEPATGFALCITRF